VLLLKIERKTKSIASMSTLAEIEEKVRTLSQSEQTELLRRLSQQLEESRSLSSQLPIIPKTGRSITQQEIDDAVET
jgi:hypothetical protein